MLQTQSNQVRRSWPDYAAVWRWHFYAGLFCLPFICWLSVTGPIYLFRPDIEAWLDRPYEALPLDGPRAAPSAEVRAAIAAVPGSVLSRYEPPATATGAAQIVVARDKTLFRVYVHPATLQAMSVARDDHRFMELIAQLHGNLLLGSRGSMVVEVAASWAIVMILTGLYLWLPRGASGLGGLLYPRFGRQGRQFWRDLHAVTGLWVSVVALFILISGLPWSSNWGHYLTWARNQWSVTSGMPDWPVGGAVPPGRVVGPPADAEQHSRMPGMTEAELSSMSPPATQAAQPAPDLDRIVPVAARLHLPRPVWIIPPPQGGQNWTISSVTQNRPLRVDYTTDPAGGAVSMTRDFAGENVVDRVVNVAIAAHEGQLFGRLNQAILLLTAIGLLLVSISAMVMWWRRRPAYRLGAPQPAARPYFSVLLTVAIAALAVLLPLFGVSLLVVLAADRTLLRHLPAARRWLGLTPRGI